MSALGPFKFWNLAKDHATVKWIAYGVFFTVTFVWVVICVYPIITTVPSETARRHWETNYKWLLPEHYSDFRAIWQSQDIGVQIFSFRCPDNLSGPQALRLLAGRLRGYQTVEEGADFFSSRRYSKYYDPGGFDEFRFIYRASGHRIYGMFANLAHEPDVRDGLVRQLDEAVAAP